MKKIFMLVMASLPAFAFAQNPGNIGTTNLTAWLRGDDLSSGSAVNGWGTAYPVGGFTLTPVDGNSAPMATNAPTGNVSNYNVTVDFTGSTDANNRALYYAPTGTLNLLDNSGSTSQGTMFMVYHIPDPNVTISTTGQHMLQYREANSSGDGIQFRRLATTNRLAIGSSGNVNATRDYNESFIPTIISYKGNYLNSMAGYQSNETIPTATVASSSSGLKGLYVGTRRNQTSSAYEGSFPGYISEIIFYNTNLTAAQFAKVHSYLAIKYGITLANTPTALGSNGNYVSTDGTVIWDATVNPGYHKDVIGIGRDDDEMLMQKQSHTYDDSLRLYVGNLAASNLANTGTIAVNKGYVIVGHDGGALYNASNSTEYPAGVGIVSRIDREWKITKTTFTDNIKVDVTLNALANPGSINLADLRVLVDDDGNFNNAFVLGAAEGITFSRNGNVLTIGGLFGAVPSGTGYVTIATANPALPIKFANFNARAVSNQKVLVEWDAFSNNDFATFEVERSVDSYNWKSINTISASGLNSTNNFRHYTITDNEALVGRSFYRVRGKDVDGKEYFTDTRRVDIKPNGVDYFAYPNPAQNTVYVNMENIQGKQVKVFDILGKDVSRRVTLRNTNSLIQIDISKLSSGIYFIKVDDQSISFVK